MFTTIGEIRGVSSREINGTTRYSLMLEVVSDSTIQNLSIGLSEDNVRAGFANQLQNMKGKQVIVDVMPNVYKDRLYWNYNSKKLPVENTKIKAAS